MSEKTPAQTLMDQLAALQDDDAVLIVRLNKTTGNTSYRYSGMNGYEILGVLKVLDMAILDGGFEPLTDDNRDEPMPNSGETEEV